MGLFYKNNTVPPTRYNGINTAESVFGTPIPIIIGQQRAGWKLLWYGDFSSAKAKDQGGGSGLGKGGTSYVYAASVIGAVCMGPTYNFLALWDSISRFAMLTHTESFTVGGGLTYTPTNGATFRQDLGAGYSSNYSVTVNDYGSPGPVTLTGTQLNPLQFTTSPTPGPGQYTITNSPNIGPFLITSVANTSGGNTVYTGTFTGGVGNAFSGFNFATEGALNAQNDGQFQCVASTNTTLTLNNPNGVAETRTMNAIVISGNPTYVFNAAQNGQPVTVIYTSFSYQLQETELQVAASTVTVQFQTSFVSDEGVSYFPSGIALTPVSGTPSVTGTYNPNGGNYKFAPGDVGAHAGVTISYAYNNPNTDANAPSSINLTFFTGGLGQAPWAYLASKHPAESLGYSEVAYVASSGLYLGFSPMLPQYNFEILGAYSFGNGISDANPADAIYGLCTDPRYKINFPIQNIDASLLQGNSSAKTMWSANQFFISAVLDNQSPLMSVINTWCEAGQVYLSWDEGRLKFIPLVDTSAVANGVTYNPPTQPVIDLDDSDFFTPPNTDPIQIEQAPWQSRWNRVSVRWSVRSNSYNEDILQVQDEGSIQQYGLISEGAQDYQFICTESCAQFAANTRMQRLSAIYTKYKFTLKSNFAFLSPGDVITVTDGQLGTSGTMFGRTPIRITKMGDDSKGGIQIEAENYPWSVGTSLIRNVQSQLPSNTNDAPQANPGDTTPIIFEVPNQAAQWQGSKIFVFANGKNSNWGGFELYVSFNGVDYNFYGKYSNPGKIGTTTADFPIPAGFTLGGTLPFLDSVDTLSVDMAVSGATLLSVTAPDRDAFVTLSALVTAGAITSTQKRATQGLVVGVSTSAGVPGSQGPNLPTVALQAAVWTPIAITTWSNLSNALTTGGSYASVALDFASASSPPNTGWSKFIISETFNFNLVGAGPIIGITVSAKAFKSAAGGGVLGSVLAFLVKGGAVIGVSTAYLGGTGNLTTTPTVYTVGSASSLAAWGLGNSTVLTPSDINTEGFGVAFVGIIGGTDPALATINLNDISMTVYWAAGGAAVGWTNPQNVGSAVSYSVANLTTSQFTQVLLATGFNFNLPFGFVLDGIQVDIDSVTTGGGTSNLIASLYSKGLQIGVVHGTTTQATQDYPLGGQADMWGIEQYADIDTLNDGTFGVGIYFEGTVGQQISVRNVRITVYGSSATNLELISYQTATLTGQNTYDITSIQRGVMGSYPCDHPQGATFARLDQATLTYVVPANYLGNTIFFKFLSFNAYGNQLQSLGEVVPYELEVGSLSPGAIDPFTGNLRTGTPNWTVPQIEAVQAAVHGSFGIQNIPAGYGLVGPVNKSSGIPQWVPVISGGGGSGTVANLFVIVVTGNFTAAAFDDCICDTTGGNLSVTFPAASLNPNTAIAVQKNSSDANTITILPTGGDTIQKASSLTISGFGDSLYFVSDGGSNWVILTGWIQPANDIYLYFPPVSGTYVANQELFYSIPVRSSTLPTSLTGSHAGCRVAPTGTVHVTILKNGISIGTVDIAAGATTATFTFSSTTTINGSTDSLSFTAPASPDATFSGFWVDIKGTRSL